MEGGYLLAGKDKGWSVVVGIPVEDRNDGFKMGVGSVLEDLYLSTGVKSALEEV